MRIVEPKQFKRLVKPKRRRRSLLMPLVAALAIGGGLTYAWLNPPDLRQQTVSTPAPTIEQAIPVEPTKKGQLKSFTGEEFKELYRSLAHPNTQPFTEPPEITGDVVADARIRTMAEARGYKLTAIPVSALVKSNEATPNNDDLIQPLAFESWKSLKEAARKENIGLSLYSAYRSPEFQRDLFTSRLYARDVSAESIASGRSDSALEAVLQQTAVPGYSRHHSGYVVDFQCDDGAGSFGASSCFRWLSANNYQHAKEHGWIPSYPDEAGEQGPEPEEWEYVWVGLEALTE